MLVPLWCPFGNVAGCGGLYSGLKGLSEETECLEDLQDPQLSNAQPKHRLLQVCDKYRHLTLMGMFQSHIAFIEILMAPKKAKHNALQKSKHLVLTDFKHISLLLFA